MEHEYSKGEDLIQPKQVNFDSAEGFLIVELEMEAFNLQSEGVWYESRHFKPKDEVHITILSREAAETVRQHLEHHPEQEDRLRRLINDTSWKFRKLDSFYHAQEGPGSETIIQMVEVPELAAFFKQLEELVGKELELPPTHVTLYMRGTEKGIGLPTPDEFERLVQKQVQLSDLMSGGDR